MKTTLFILLLSTLLSLAEPTGNIIHIQNEQVSMRCPASWAIIAHKHSGSPSDIVAFQIPNPADEGSDDSCNLSIVAFDVRQTDAMLKFTQRILEHEKKKHPSKEIGGWAVHTWSDKQGDTNYDIRDCYRTAKPFGLHVRLAIPKLPKTTKQWSENLETDFNRLLESLEIHAPTKDPKAPKRTKSAGGQTIIEEFYEDGTIKTITRLHPDDSLLGILHHTPKGVPTHADYYDDKKRIRRTLYYREDGTAKSTKEFDQNGKVVLEQELDSEGNVTKETKPQ